ncbi:MAG: alpha/beta fold hydrolase [Vulcanimicrobiaceae bacterium]
MRVNNDGAHIDVRIDGVADPAIVLLAGFPLTRGIWDDVAPVLVTEHRIVAIDLRGTGASSVPPGPYLMETMAADVAAVLDALGIERAMLVGHSLGGYVALAFARMYAERVERLALVCSRIAADTPERARWRNGLADRAEQSGSAREILDATMPALLAPQTRALHPEVELRVRAIAERNDARGLAALLRGMALRDAADDIVPDLAMPVLVVAGAADLIVGQGEARSMATTFPNGRFALCDQSGHVPMVEEPERLGRLLLEFSRAR